jgi:hypothetical protein
MSDDQLVQGNQAQPHLLGIYLNDHLAGAAGGSSLAHRVAGSHKGTAAERELAELAQAVAEDRDALLDIMRRLGIARTYYKETVAAVAERIGRLKLTGHLLRRSPLSSVVEFEAMALGVTGKRSGWRTLRALAETDTRLDKRRLNALITRADNQLEALEQLRLRAVIETFATS